MIGCKDNIGLGLAGDILLPTTCKGTLPENEARSESRKMEGEKSCQHSAQLYPKSDKPAPWTSEWSESVPSQFSLKQFEVSSVTCN